MSKLLLVLVGVAAFLALAPGSPARPSCVHAAGLHHAALVIEHGDHSVLDYCVGFDQDSVTGEQLLQLSGVEFGAEVYGGLGDAICQIDHEPSTYPPNPPGCLTSGQPYWNLFVSRAGGAWTGSSLGVSRQVFRDGDAEGWRWTAGGSGPPPAPVCTVAAPPPTEPPAATQPPPAQPAAPATAGSADSATPAGEQPSPSLSPAAASPAEPSASPSAQAPSRAPSPPIGPSLGLAAAAAGFGGMLGLALLRLLGPRLRR